MIKLQKRKVINNITGYVLLIPFLVGMIGFTIYPLILAFAQSLFKNYNPLDGAFNADDFGLYNYITVFTDEEILKSMARTVVYTAINLPLTIAVSFLLAYFLTMKVKGTKAFRVIVYLPAIIPGIVGAAITKYIFSSNGYGLINTVRASMGLESTGLLESKSQVEAMASFIATGFFSFGCSSPMWIAGFNSVPRDVFEAAALDGCGRAKTLVKITIPLMGRFIFLQVLGGLIGSFQIGESVLQISPSGGYRGNLNFYGLLIYNQTQGAGGYNYGLASALSYVLFVVVGILSIIMFKFNKNIYYEE